MKKWQWIALGACAVAGYVCSLIAGAHHWWETIPFFWSIFGFLGCALIVYFSKGLGKLFLQQPEDFYDD